MQEKIELIPSRIANHQREIAKLRAKKPTGWGNAAAIKFKIDNHLKAIEDLEDAARRQEDPIL